jgi:hypothetical protein
LPIGIIGIVLGIVLIFAGGYAENYRKYLDTWHDYGGMRVRDSIMPYTGWAFPLEVFGLCALVVGIVSILYDYISMRGLAS